MKSIENLDIKSKRIVYQMSRELEKTNVTHDFHNALLSLEMPKNDKHAGFNAYLTLQNQIKESLKTLKTHGETSDLLRLLSGSQMKCVNQMLNPGIDKELPRKKFQKNTNPENGEYSGESVKAKKIQVVVEDVEEIPVVPVPFGIPPLQVDQLYDDLDESDEIEWVSSRPSSSRIPETPMEPLQRPKSIIQEQKNVTFVVEPVVRKILSRPRPIEKSDAQIQTDEIEEEEDEQEKGEEQVMTAEMGTNCRLLITPRVEEDDDSYRNSPILSPLGTISSEGEVVHPNAKVITVRPDGSIVPTPRAIEDVDEEEIGYDGDYDVASDVLVAKSSGSFGVAEVDLSISSAHTQ